MAEVKAKRDSFVVKCLGSKALGLRVKVVRLLEGTVRKGKFLLIL